MIYGVIWDYKDPCGETTQKLVSSPEALIGTETPEAAKNEGRQILKELSPENRLVMMPSAVVEITEEMLAKIDNFPTIELSSLEEDETLEFKDVSSADFWAAQGWWYK